MAKDDASRRSTAAPVAGPVRVVAENFGYRVAPSLAAADPDVPVARETGDGIQAS